MSVGLTKIGGVLLQAHNDTRASKLLLGLLQDTTDTLPQVDIFERSTANVQRPRAHGGVVEDGTLPVGNEVVEINDLRGECVDGRGGREDGGEDGGRVGVGGRGAGGEEGLGDELSEGEILDGEFGEVEGGAGGRDGVNGRVGGRGGGARGDLVGEGGGGVESVERRGKVGRETSRSCHLLECTSRGDWHLLI
jgi:hypothetical protein